MIILESMRQLEPDRRIDKYIYKSNRYGAPAKFAGATVAPAMGRSEVPYL